jgi:hypothetical protein
MLELFTDADGIPVAKLHLATDAVGNKFWQIPVAEHDALVKLHEAGAEGFERMGNELHFEGHRIRPAG